MFEKTEEAIKMVNPEKKLATSKTKSSKVKTQHNMHWTHSVNNTWTLLQTTGGKDELSIVFYGEIVNLQMV